MDFSISQSDKNFTIDEHHILEAFDYLAPYHKETKLEEFGAISGQKGGSCMPSCTKKWSRFKFDSLEDYKVFQASFDLILIHGLYKELTPYFEEPTKEGKTARTAFIYAAEKLANELDKVQIFEELALDAMQQLQKWILELKIKSHTFEVEAQKKINDVKLLCQNLEPQLTQRTMKRYWVEQSQFCDNHGAALSTLPDFFNLQESAVSFLKQLETSYENKLKDKTKFGHKEAANLTLHFAIDQLPLPDSNSDHSFWNRLSRKERLQCAMSLRKMGELYLQSHSNDLPPRRFATLFAIYAIIDQIACLSSPSYSLYTPPFPGNLLNQMESLNFHSTDEFNRIEAIKAYFQTRSQKKKAEVFDSELQGKVVKDTIEKGTSTCLLWDDLLTANDNLRKAVDGEAPLRFREYTQKEIDADFKRQEDDLAAWYAEEKECLKSRRYGGLRQKPELNKLQNLPLVTKRTLLMSEFDSTAVTFGNPLLAQAEPEINEIRFLSHLIHCSFHSIHPSTSLKREATWPDPYKMDCSVSSSWSDWNRFDKETWNQFIHNNEYLPNWAHRDFFKLPQTSRLKKQWERPIAEVHSLNKNNIPPPILYQSARTLSEWKLTPSQLLYEWGKNYELLKDPQLQTVFLRLFFRSPIQGKKEKVHLGAGELLQQEALLQNLSTTIAQGLSYFTQLKRKANKEYSIADVEGVKFLFELSYLCQKYLVEQGKKGLSERLSCEKALKEWIEDGSVSRTPRALLRLYRILHLSLDGPIEKLSRETLQTIVLDWTILHLYSDGERPSQIAPSIYQWADSFIASLLKVHQSTFEKDPSFFCEPIFREIESTDQQLSWKIGQGHPIYEGTKRTKETYIVNFRRGEFFTPTGKASRVVVTNSWEQDPHFKRIFWKPYSYVYSMGGQGVVTFNHPQLGYCRIFLAKYYQKYLFQRQHRGEWYQYIPPEEIGAKQLGLTAAFTKDHIVWAQVKVEAVEMVKVVHNTSSNQQHLSSLILHLIKTRKNIQVEVDLNQTLQGNLDRIRKAVHENSPAVKYITIIFCGCAIKPTDRLIDLKLQQATVCQVLINEGDEPTAHSISLESPPLIERVETPPPPPVNLHPFKAVITSLQTGEVVFQVDEKGQIVQAGSSFYYLDFVGNGLEHFEDKEYIYTVSDALGNTESLHFPRIRSLDGNPLLFIKDKDKPRLVWNDNQQYALEKTPAGFFECCPNFLYLTPPSPKDPPILLVAAFRFVESDLPIEAWGSIIYFEYHIHQEKLIAQSVEGRFFLAYLYFKDKKYDLACALMKQYDPLEVLSPLAFHILALIQTEKLPSDHVDAKMVPFIALLAMIKEKDRQSKESLSAYFKSEVKDLEFLSYLISLCSHLLQESAYISEPCNLSQAEKNFVMQKIVNEIEEKRNSFSQLKLEFPQAPLDQVRHFLENPSVRGGPQNALRTPKETSLIAPSSFHLPHLHGNKDEDRFRYEVDCERATLWLTSGQVPSLVSRWPISFFSSPEQNGKLFFEVLQIARSQDNKRALAMVWKLRNWRLYWKEDKASRPFLDLMLAILLNRITLPPFDPEKATPQEKVDFLKLLQSSQVTVWNDFHSAIAHYLASHKGPFSPSTRARRFALTIAPSFKEPSLTDFGDKPKPLLQAVQGNYDQARTNLLKTWESDFFKPAPEFKRPISSPPQFRVEPRLLSEQNEQYHNLIENDLRALTADTEEGFRQLQLQEEITLIKPVDFLTKVKETKETYTTELKQKEEKAKEILNRAPEPFEKFFHRISQITSGSKKEIGLDEAGGALRRSTNALFRS